MNLFEKIDLFYKKAQELKSDLGDDGTSGKPVIPSKLLPEGGGYPNALLRAIAKSALTKLVSNPEVPMTVKKDFNKLGDYLRDFLNGRFSDKDLNYHWDSYLAALMDKANLLKRDAGSKSLGDFYQSLYTAFSVGWDDIAKIEAWKPRINKPTAVEMVGAVEDPWAKTENQMMDEAAKKQLQDTGTTTPLRDPFAKPASDSKKRMNKIAQLLKK